MRILYQSPNQDFLNTMFQFMGFAMVGAFAVAISRGLIEETVPAEKQKLLPARIPVLGRVDWMPRKKVWRVIWYKNGDVPMGDFPTREEAEARLRELVDKRHSKGKNPTRKKEPWEAIDDKRSKDIIITYGGPELQWSLRYIDSVAVGDRLLYALMLAEKHDLPDKRNLRKDLKRYFPAKLDWLEEVDEEDEEDDNEEEQNLLPAVVVEPMDDIRGGLDGYRN